MPARKIYLPADCPSPESRVVFTKPDTQATKKTKPTHQHTNSASKQPTQQKPLHSNSTTKVPLNTATQAQLETLPGIGPALAKRILERRAKRPFKRLAQLRYVKGIGPAKYKKIKPFVVLNAPTLKQNVSKK